MNSAEDSRSGVAELAAIDAEDMKAFWTLYEEHHAEISQELTELAAALPAFGSVMRRMSKEDLDEQNQMSRDLMRRAVLQGEWEPLLDSHRQQGAMYAAMGVPFSEWFEIVSAYQTRLVPHAARSHEADVERLTRMLRAMNTYVNVAMGVIGDEYLRTKERIISQQQISIEELSTPVLQVRDRMLLVPLVGLLDTRRARHLTEQLLKAIRQHRAKVVVIDITGVAAVDSKVANHLFQTVAAARLMGARVLITGLSGDVAQALVTLGIDTDQLDTLGDLQEGIEEAERLLGYQMGPLEADATQGH